MHALLYYNIVASFQDLDIILYHVRIMLHKRVASSPGPSQPFQHCMRKAGGPGIRSHMTNFIRMKGGQRVKMNVGEAKVSDVQDPAIHDLGLVLEVT